MPASTAHPSTLPSFALMVSNNYLTSRLQTELNKNRKITFNVPMSLMVQFGDDPRCFLEDLFIKWWTEHFTPITAGYTVFDQKLNSEIERDIESALVRKASNRRSTQHGLPIYEGLVDSAHLTKTKFRLSLSSTDLSEEAQGRLVEPLATTNLFCWTPVACAVLSANDLLRSRDSDPKYSLASILVVALTIWRLKTPQLSFDERKAEWNRTVDLLKAGSSPLLKASFYNDVELVCTDEAAIGDDDFHGFDDELEAYGGPDGGHISAAFIEVRDYRPSNGRRNSAGSRSSSPSHKHIRHSSPSPAHSLSKCCFTPRSRSEV